jgi:hypothetical protein
MYTSPAHARSFQHDLFAPRGDPAYLSCFREKITRHGETEGKGRRSRFNPQLARVHDGLQPHKLFGSMLSATTAVVALDPHVCLTKYSWT